MPKHICFTYESGTRPHGSASRQTKTCQNTCVLQTKVERDLTGCRRQRSDPKHIVLPTKVERALTGVLVNKKNMPKHICFTNESGTCPHGTQAKTIRPSPSTTRAHNKKNCKTLKTDRWHSTKQKHAETYVYYKRKWHALSRDAGENDPTLTKHHACAQKNTVKKLCAHGRGGGDIIYKK